jgi:hypothetical protein
LSKKILNFFADVSDGCILELGDKEFEILITHVLTAYLKV